MTQQDSITSVRHSLAHLLAYSLKQLYPGSQNAIGPAIDNGFYQDFEIKGDFGEEDLAKVENKMKEVLKTWQGFERKEVSLDEALEIFSDNKYKQQLAREFSEDGKTLTVYTSGEFDDLCKGGHVDDITKINPNAFKLTKTAGAYWKGDENNIMLTRVYGVAFAAEEELKKHLQMLEEAKKRDHRRLGQELDLFVFSDLVGSGLPLYTPRGTQIITSLNSYAQQLRSDYGYQRVVIPHITKTDLYKTSGHWDKFGGELFLVKSQESSDEFVLKPMNCPHHAQIFAAKPRSYREMPVKYMETTTTYRDEKKGELHGLSRVRSILMDDSHVFARESQIESVVGELLDMVMELYKRLDMEVKFRLSFRDGSDAYLGDKQLWDKAQVTIEDLAKKNDLNYYVEEGEAAFYGPKIDFIAVDALSREWQVATVQLDFVQPERFDLGFVNEQGETERPVMVHAALLGSLDRFLSVYIEHTAGRFPVWLAPEQIRIATVNKEDSTVKFAEEVFTKAKARGLRVELDNSNESVGKKIRDSEIQKVPYTLVIGQKEVESGRVNPRIRKDIEVDEAQEPIEVDEFIGTVANEAKSRVTRTSMHGHETHRQDV